MSFNRVSCWFLKNTIGLHKNLTARNFSCTYHQAMKFVQYKEGCDRGLGILLNDGKSIVSLNGADPTIPIDMVSFLHSEYSIERIEKFVENNKLIHKRYNH